jgi:hypothetical protein
MGYFVFSVLLRINCCHSFHIDILNPFCLSVIVSDVKMLI